MRERSPRKASRYRSKMSAGSLAILADYEDDDTDLDDTANPESKVYGSHLRGQFTVSQDGRCPRCETKNVLFVILDELFPTGDMPEILYDLIAKGKAVLWSSQVKKGCKAPPTFLCRGFCPPDPLGAGFNINWSKNTLRDIFFSAKPTDTLDPYAEDYVNSQQGTYNPNYESGNKDIQESTEASNDNEDNDEEEEEDEDDDIDEDELIKQMLAKEAMKAQENAETDTIQPNITSEITETENPVQTSDETRTIYYTQSSNTTLSTDTTENKDDKSDDLTPVTQIAQSSTETNKVYPVSSNGACPYCSSKNVQYIIVCTSDLQDKDLPYTLRELLKREQAFKMAKGENDPPSFLCRNCHYGFNLDWSITNLELIFGIPKKPSKKHQAAATTGHGVAPHVGYPPPQVPPMAPPANVPPPALPPRGYPPPYQGFPPPAVPPPAMGPPGAFPMPPPRLPPPRVPPPYSHGHPRFTPPPAYPPRVPPPGYTPPGVPPQWLPHAQPRFPPPPPGQGSPRYPVHGTSPHLPRVPPRVPPPPPPPPPFGQYSRVPPRYPPPGDYHYGYQQQFRPPAGYPQVEAGYHGYPGYSHTNPYYPPQAPPMPPPPGQFPYHHPPYYQQTAGYPPIRPSGYSQPPAPGTENYPPTQTPTSYPSSYHKTHPQDTSKTDTQSLTAEEKEQEDQDEDQVIDEKSLEDSQRFEELLNQIDHSRGVTSSERSDLDLDWSQNEPNSISEEHGDAEYDEGPPGDDYDDTTTEFQTAPSATKKQKSTVKSKEPIPDQEPSDVAMETAAMEAQEPTPNITEPHPGKSEEQDTSILCQEQTEESEETMAMSDDVTAKEMVVKETVVKKVVGKRTPKGRRGRKRKAAEEPQEETIAKQLKVTDESSQEESEVMKVDGGSVQQSANHEHEEPVPEKESKPIGRRGTRGRKATNQSKQATKNEVTEVNEMEEEERKDTVSEPTENEQFSKQEVNVKAVKGKARRSRKVEDENQESQQSSGMEDEVPPPSTSTRQRRGRSQGGLPDKEAETTTKAAVTSTRQHQGRLLKEKVEKESEPNIFTDEPEQTIPEASVNEDQSYVTNTSTTGRRRGRSQRATKMEVLVTNQAEEGTSMTEIRTAPEQIKIEDKEGVKEKEDITETEPTASQQSDMEAPTGRRRGRLQRGSSKEGDSTDAGHTDSQQSDVEAPTGRRRGWLKRGSSKEGDSTDAGHTDSQQSDVEAPTGRRRGWLKRGSSKEGDITDTGHTDSQQSDVEATTVPAWRRRGRLQKDSTTEEELTDPQESDVKATAVITTPAGRRSGRSLRGSSKKVDTELASESASQEPATTSLDESTTSDVDHNSKTPTTRKGKAKKTRQEQLDNNSTSQSEGQDTEDVIRKKPTRKRKSSDLTIDVDSGSTTKMEEQNTHDNQTVGRKKTARRRQSFDMNSDINPGDSNKNKGKKTQSRNTPSNDDIEDTSDEIEMSNQAPSTKTTHLSKASLNKDQSTESSLISDDPVESQHLEPSAKTTRSHKITTAKTSRVLRKRN